MCPLNLSFAIFAAGGKFGGINECLFLQIEACGGEAMVIFAKEITLKALFGHCGEASRMDILSLDGRDVSSISRNNSIFRLDGILHNLMVTLLWKCAYDDLYIFP